MITLNNTHTPAGVGGIKEFWYKLFPKQTVANTCDITMSYLDYAICVVQTRCYLDKSGEVSAPAKWNYTLEKVGIIIKRYINGVVTGQIPEYVHFDNGVTKEQINNWLETQFPEIKKGDTRRVMQELIAATMNTGSAVTINSCILFPLSVSCENVEYTEYKNDKIIAQEAQTDFLTANAGSLVTGLKWVVLGGATLWVGSKILPSVIGAISNAKK